MRVKWHPKMTAYVKSLGRAFAVDSGTSLIFPAMQLSNNNNKTSDKASFADKPGKPVLILQPLKHIQITLSIKLTFYLLAQQSRRKYVCMLTRRKINWRSARPACRTAHAWEAQWPEERPDWTLTYFVTWQSSRQAVGRRHYSVARREIVYRLQLCNYNQMNDNHDVESTSMTYLNIVAWMGWYFLGSDAHIPNVSSWHQTVLSSL